MPKLYQNVSLTEVHEAMIEIIKSAACKENSGMTFYSEAAKETLNRNMSGAVKIINGGMTMNIASTNRRLRLNYPDYDFDRKPISAETFTNALKVLGLETICAKFFTERNKAAEAETAWNQACAQLFGVIKTNGQ